MEVIVLFGAGVYAKKYKALLEYLHLDFDYFSDNDSSKWGTMLYGKRIIEPSELINLSDCKIIISCTHELAIRQQLSEMGLGDRIIGLDDLYDLCEGKVLFQKQVSCQKNAEKMIVIDMYEGIGWGGSELWAANLAYGLKKRGKHILLLGGTEQPSLEERYETCVVRIPEYETITRMADLFEKNLPCVFINNFAGCAFMAAIIVKRRYPNKVKIISVIHNDNKSLFDAHMLMAKYIDAIFCVSNQIMQHMIEVYCFEPDKYYFKEQPIVVNKEWARDRNSGDVLRIGYAGRLVCQQKRADLLPELISCLVERKIEFLFQIAGEGECTELIREFISRKSLENKVQLLGRLSQSEMEKFWSNQDVVVNISEYEGTSLSMLEAMSFACVPVVTDVSGAREFIEVGENGYICAVGDFGKMAECISVLFEDRNKLESYGEKCRKIIEEKCNPDQYLDYWIENLI